jgi:hypothetical protein
MNLALKKVELAKAILSTDDKNLIRQIEAIIETRMTHNWNDFPDEMRQRLEKSLAKADKGIGMPHDKFIKKYKRWLIVK